MQSKSQERLPQPSGCVSAYNVMRGCPLYFRIYSPDPASPCPVPEKFSCSEKTAPVGFEKSAECD
jgi:hypothetical protein